VKRVGKRVAGEHGAAAVEMALIAPLLFMLIFGITEFGLAWSKKQVYVQAAREGARYAAVGCEGTCGDNQVRDRVVGAAVGYPITGGAGAISVNPNGCSTTDPSQTVTVGWTQNFQINIPFVPPINLNAPIQAVFRCEL
jgi:Flp pilus assembly protein TadG